MRRDFGRFTVSCLRGEQSQLRLPVARLDLEQVQQQRSPVFLEAGEVRAYAEVGVGARAHCEVVGLAHDGDAVREGALAADVLLEGGGGRAPTVDLPIEGDLVRLRVRVGVGVRVGIRVRVCAGGKVLSG